jgi:PspA associated protein B
MGLLDILTGKRKLAKPAPDRLFAITTAYVTMQTSLDITSRGGAAIVFQSLQTADFAAIVKDMEEVVRATAGDSGTIVDTSVDSYGFSWLVLKGESFDDLVVGINAVATAIDDGGYGERLLCAVFAFSDAGGKALYLIYNFKRGAFYPFVPAGPQQRDNERELVLRAQLGSELPIETELTRWFALWGIPI